MLNRSQGLEFYGANPSVKVVGTPRGYRIAAIQSRSVVARVGSMLLVVFCLIFLSFGVAVWFLPDSVFNGDPQLLKFIVTGATWTLLAPLFYFSFISPTTSATEVDLSGQTLHQIFMDRRGRETKRRSVAFADIEDLELLSNDSIVRSEADNLISEYGQIYLRLNARKGRSLLWGSLVDLEPVWLKMRQDVLPRSQ